MIRLCFFILALAPLAVGAPHPKWEALCPEVRIRAGTGVGLSSEEKFLVCGDTEINAWQRVSVTEAKHYMKIALETKGYPQPVFRETDGILYVEPGPALRLKSIRAVESGASHSLPVPPGLWSRPVTPKVLETVASWLENRKRSEGWPCPQVNLTVDPEKGEIVAHIDKGRQLAIHDWQVETPLPQALIARNLAFEEGDPYDKVAFLLSEQRLLASESVQSGFLRHRCTPEGVEVFGEVQPAPGKIIRIGAGLNSETWFKVRALWRNHRVGELASDLTARAEASRQVQELSGIIKWFPWTEYPKHHLFADARLEHHWEKFSRWVRLSVNPAAQLVFDTSLGRTAFSLGPEFSLTRNIEGPGTKEIAAIALKFQASLLTPMFELYRMDPRTGGYLSVDTAVYPESFGSEVNYFTYGLQGARYWTLWDTGTPFFLFVLSGGIRSTVVINGQTRSLPPNAFHFLGGSKTIRGFARNALPGENGSLFRTHLSAEWIFRGAIWEKFDPYFFVDVGKTGTSLAKMDDPTYWSPGMGLRWRSPVGPLSVSLGHGLAGSGVASGWNVYLSLGEEL